MTDASCWIWWRETAEKDEYAEFCDVFPFSGQKTAIEISADSNYELYVNGVLAAFGQYADFPHDKIYDTVDLTPFCQSGENRLAVRVWYYGLENASTYAFGRAALRYEVVAGGAVLCASRAGLPSRKSPSYKSGYQKHMTMQIGYSYYFDASREDGWQTRGVPGFTPAVRVDQDLPLRPRPNKKLVLGRAREGRVIKTFSPTRVLFDLGRETVGFLSLSLVSQSEQTLTVSFGEHIADGCVRRKIGSRDFSVEYRAKKGDNEFLNAFRRLGARYLEIESEAPVTFRRVALVPTDYPLARREKPSLNEFQNKLYDMCLETLRLCMHEHYEDCPWREQSLYCMDSRNQMLCGYYAFGEYEFPRACLRLIASDKRPDGLLSICFPVSWDYVIPSFSLHYLTECREYLDYSGDTAFLREIDPKLRSILTAFTDKRTDGGLVPPLEGPCYWNFYEWRDGLNGHSSPTGTDLLLNALLSLALKNYAHICQKLGQADPFAGAKEEINEKLRQRFFDPARGLFFDRENTKTYSQLGNALAVLCGAAEDPKHVCEALLHEEDLTVVSLSMAGFVYDALLATDEAYAHDVLSIIERVYRPMVESGTDTVWETEVGQSDFGDAGSLCHGWSALPIYYYHRLIGGENEGTLKQRLRPQ